MRTAFGLGLVAVVFGVAGCNKADNLDGTYVIVGMERRGEKAPEAVFTKESEADRTIKIAGDKLIATKGGKDDTITVKYDSSKNPKHITTTESKPNGKTETMYGIYKLEGDTLTVCVVESDKESDRPTEFKTTKEGKTMMMTLKKKP